MNSRSPHSGLNWHRQNKGLDQESRLWCADDFGFIPSRKPSIMFWACPSLLFPKCPIGPLTRHMEESFVIASFLICLPTTHLSHPRQVASWGWGFILFSFLYLVISIEELTHTYLLKKIIEATGYTKMHEIPMC